MADETRDECVRTAMIKGAKTAAVALLGAGSAVGLASHFSKNFSASLGVSGKVALVVTPAFGMYFLESQLTINECARQNRRTSDNQPKAQDVSDILPGHR
ncbi:hypothetical protein WJX73_005843 [Symbiochloris irregularis]|uniref:Uncharacterized protein n=1 Tax=Symbiochloris irregularis TaxID=706552 RepID=A0AAW1PD18_9CHLO